MNKKYSSLKKEKQPSLKKVYRRKYARLQALDQRLQNQEQDKKQKNHHIDRLGSILLMISQMF